MIHSAHLTMLPFSSEDADSLLSVFRNPSVRRYLLDDTLVSFEWVNNEIASSNLRFAGGSAGLWAIRLRGIAAIIGFVGFREFFDPPRLQLLYGLVPEHWGKGLASEAAKRMCAHAFFELGFPRIEAAMDSPNARSIAVAVRLGMHRMVAPAGQDDSTVFYEIDRDAWKDRHGAIAAQDHEMPAATQSNDSVSNPRRLHT